jgi:hypothetical protein
LTTATITVPACYISKISMPDCRKRKARDCGICQPSTSRCSPTSNSKALSKIASCESDHGESGGLGGVAPISVQKVSCNPHEAQTCLADGKRCYNRSGELVLEVQSNQLSDLADVVVVFNQKVTIISPTPQQSGFQDQSPSLSHLHTSPESYTERQIVQN